MCITAQWTRRDFLRDERMPLSKSSFTADPLHRACAHMLCMAVMSVSFISAPAFAQRGLKNVPVPDPDVELKSFKVQEGFQANLFADTKLMHKPIQMNFDARGRLWVASSEIYPQIKPGQVADDKI